MTKQFKSLADNPDYAFSVVPRKYTNGDGKEKTSYSIVRYSEKGATEYNKEGFARIGFDGNDGKIHFYKKFTNTDTFSEL